jgi:hypothetical protein
MTLEQTPAAVGSVDAIMGRAKDGPGIFNRLPHGLGIDHSQAPDAEMSVIGNSRNCEMFPLFPGSSRSDAGQRRSPEGLINRDAAGLGAGSHLPLGPLALHLHAKSGRSGYPNESGDEKRQWDRRRSLAPWIYVGSAQNFRGAENSGNKGQRQIFGTSPDHRHRIQ